VQYSLKYHLPILLCNHDVDGMPETAAAAVDPFPYIFLDTMVYPIRDVSLDDRFVDKMMPSLQIMEVLVDNVVAEITAWEGHDM